MNSLNKQAFQRMIVDPDIAREKEPADASIVVPASARLVVAPLQVRGGSHFPSAATAALVREAGGVEGIKVFTDQFYRFAFADPHIDQFIRSHDDPHGERFANWIAEKLGAGAAWSEERRARACPVHNLGRGVSVEVHDRSSAHFAAWHSPKRDPAVWGQHFKLDDARVWMRLHFAAARSVGLFESAPHFMAYYVKFIAHFVRVYERSAPAFAREAARWSEDPANLRAYEENGRRMDDVVGVPFARAARDLPAEEMRDDGWPYAA